MKPVVSIVIPVYNTQSYIERCVSSAMEQSIQDIEIIVVDDGSEDASGKICDHLATYDHRIKVIHKKNGGLSSARNAGMNMAKGKYLFFLDSDDWLEKDGMEQLAEIAENYKTDFVRYKAIKSNWPGLPENAPCDVEPVRELKEGYYNYSKIVKEVYPRLFATSKLTMGTIVGAWGALYNLEFLRHNQIWFKEDIRYSEDMVFSADVGRKCKSFYYIEKAGIYHYFYNPNSISKSFRAGRWDSARKSIRYLEEMFSSSQNFDFRNELMYARWFLIFLGLNEKKYILDKKKRVEYVSDILNDPLTIETPLRLSAFDVNWKQKLLMVAVKHRKVNFISNLC